MFFLGPGILSSHIFQVIKVLKNGDITLLSTQDTYKTGSDRDFAGQN